MAEAFPSLSSFLNSAKDASKRLTQSSITQGTESTIQKILNDTSVRMSVYNQASMQPAQSTDTQQEVSNEQVMNAIQDGLQNVITNNATKVKTLLDSLFSSKELTSEMEHYWVDKWCSLFNIDTSMPYEIKCSIINQKLEESPEYLNYITYTLDTANR